jgi:hypothetical protein
MWMATWWQGRRLYPLPKGCTQLLLVQEVTSWSDTPHRNYCSEQPVISTLGWDRAIVFYWGGFKLSPGIGRWEPKSYEQLLPPLQIVIWRSTNCCLQVTGHHHTDRFLLLAYFPYFEKIKAGLWDCLAVRISPIIFFISMWSVSFLPWTSCFL